MKSLFTKNEISDYIKKHELQIPAEYVFDYWERKEWKTKRGTLVKTLSSAVNCCNSMYVLISRDVIKKDIFSKK